MVRVLLAAVLIITQIVVNKPYITVYFDAPSVPSSVEATLNGEALTTNSLQSFADSGEGIWSIYAVDLSTSISYWQISAVQQALYNAADTMGPNDRISLLTFGLSVEVPLDLSGDKEAIKAAADALYPNQDGTLFFDAFVEALELGERYGPDIPGRRAIYVISDAEDYSVGGYIQEEVERKLENSNIPVYGFGFLNVSREYLDAFGALTRLSGGDISIVDAYSLPGAVETITSTLRSGYVGRFAAKTNRVSNDLETLTLKVTLQDGSETLIDDGTVIPSRWIPDTIPPEVISVEQTASGTLRVEFSEPVAGADTSSNFRVQDADGNLLAIRTVSYNPSANTVRITLADTPSSGTLEVSFLGITDDSMEKNPVTDVTSIEFTGAEPVSSSMPSNAPQTTPDILIEDPQEAINPAIWLFGALILALIVVGVVFAVIRSHGGLVKVDGKLRFAGERRKEVFTSNEKAEEIQYKFVTEKIPKLDIRVIDATGKALDLAVAVQGSVFIGRSEGNDLVFDDPKMSRQHFVIENSVGKFLIQNLSSSTGTLLNGVPLKSPRPLTTGDTISAGNITFTILGGT